ncbi:hypothetical protein [Paenibacillus sp. HJGM_3]|uniref:hypothetical protein n=1 Tax=Paenibacillus sp. HJGM_3 TaxID=3379816 RepID=UPI00385F593B
MKGSRALLMVFVVGMMAMVLVLSPIGRVSANDDCGCGQVVGAEKNKIVADLLKSDAFKAKKQELLKQGYKWNGVDGAEVDKNGNNEILIAIPLLNADREEVFLIYVYGQFYVVAKPN